MLQGRADGTAVQGDPNADRLLRLTGTQSPSQVHYLVQPSVEYEAINVRQPPFTDRRVRQALNYAVDRQHIVNFVGAQRAVLTCQLLPPNFPSYQHYCPYTSGPDDGHYHGPDLAKAGRLIAASGTRGMPVTVYGDLIGNRAINAYFGHVLTELGYRVALEQRPGIDPLAAADPRLHIGVTLAGWGADYPSPATFWDGLFSCPSHTPTAAPDWNISGYCNPHIDQLAADALTLARTDPGRARRVWTQLDHQITDDAPLVPLYNDVLPVVVSRRIGNFQANHEGEIYDQMWIK